MSRISGKKILLGVTGSIAAYKSAYLASALVKSGADVHVVMTDHARELIAPSTFWSITSNPVVEKLFEKPSVYEISHVSLPETADIFLIVPATANIIAKIAHGIADDMLSTMALTARCPMLIAPAMNCNMYLNPVTQHNLSKLRDLRKIIVEPESGRLACGDEGVGRLVDPDIIYSMVEDLLSDAKRDFAGLRVLVTAGPTQEAIDPVRFLSNKSSGKMGYAVAEAASKRGAQVTLVSGPTNLSVPAGVKMINIVSVNEMWTEVLKEVQDADIFISAAAPADFVPAEIKKEKIKKTQSLTLDLAKSRDILAEVGKNKGSTFLVGFAAETQDLVKNAKIKLESKNLDLIVGNDVSEEGKVFGSDTNKVVLLSVGSEAIFLQEMPKIDVAHKILDYVKNKMEETIDG